MTRALVTQMLEALDESRGDVGQCLQEELPKAGYERYDRRIKAITEQLEKHDAAIKAAREYLATEPSGERAELISDLRRIADEGMADYANTGYPNSNAIKKAADMLEADAQQATPYGWMVIGVPTVMRGSLAQEIQEQEAKRIGGTCKAFPVYTSPQQAKRVPMTEKQIDKIHADTARLAQIRTTFFIAFARAIEAHHGITPAEKPTGWDNGLSQDYCAEFGKWLASRPGARQQIKEMFEATESEDLYELALKADNWGQP